MEEVVVVAAGAEIPPLKASREDGVEQLRQQACDDSEE